MTRYAAQLEAFKDIFLENKMKTKLVKELKSKARDFALAITEFKTQTSSMLVALNVVKEQAANVEAVRKLLISRGVCVLS